MNFNKTTEYSFRILSFMAIEEDKRYSADVLSENLEIPFRYLRKQLTRLAKSGLLVSFRGKSGGYMIARKLDQITLYDIVQAAGEKTDQHICILGFDNCVFGKRCIFHGKWVKFQETIDEMLKSTTLEDIKKTKPKRFTIQHNLMLTKNN